MPLPSLFLTLKMTALSPFYILLSFFLFVSRKDDSYVRSTPPRKFVHSGSALLAVVIVLAIISSMIGLSVAKIGHASMNATASNKITMQAQQYAETEAELVRSISYSDLKNSGKTDIGKSGFKKEVTLGEESDYSGNIKQRNVDIKIYHENEELPRADMVLTRYKVAEEAGGCQIVTGTNNVSFTANGSYKSVTVISSAIFIPLDGGWTGKATYNIAVDGASLGNLTCTSVTYKGGSKGHYWGTKTSVTNQKTVNANIVKGTAIDVKLSSSSRMDTSTITVILGS